MGSGGPDASGELAVCAFLPGVYQMHTLTHVAGLSAQSDF